MKTNKLFVAAAGYALFLAASASDAADFSTEIPEDMEQQVGQVASVSGEPVSALREVLLPKLMRLQMRMQLAQIAILNRPVGSTVYRNQYQGSILLINVPIFTVPKRELLDYYAKAARELKESSEASLAFSKLLMEESANPDYSDKDRRLLRAWEAQVAHGVQERGERAVQLMRLFGASYEKVMQIPGDRVAFSGPKALNEIPDSANALLDANFQESYKTIQNISALSGPDSRSSKFLTTIGGLPEETPESAQKAFAKALQEEKTTFLVYRSTPQNEAEVGQKVSRAVTITSHNPAEWRVIWIKNQGLLPSEMMDAYFGSDKNIFMISLEWGTGEPRRVAKRFELKDIQGNLDTLGAFVTDTHD